MNIAGKTWTHGERVLMPQSGIGAILCYLLGSDVPSGEPQVSPMHSHPA